MWTEKEYKIRIVAVDDNQPACDKELYQFSIVEGDSDFIIKPLIHVYNKVIEFYRVTIFDIIFDAKFILLYNISKPRILIFLL